MINWIEINSISQLCLVGVTAWYLFETRKQRKNSDKQLDLLKQQNELQNAMSIIPIIKPLEENNKTFEVVLHNFSAYEIYNVWMFYAGIYEEGSFLFISPQQYDFIEKNNSKSFSLEITLFNKINKELTEKEETNFKEQIIGNLKTFLRDPINFRNNTNKNDNNLDDTIRKILDLWDKEDIFSKAIIIFFSMTD